MAQPLEYFLFRPYSKAIKEWLNNTTHLSRYPNDQNVLVIYATPSRAFSKFMYPIQNGQLAQPTISFYITAYPYAQGENSLGFVKQATYDSSTGLVRLVTPPLVYKLTYNVTIRTVKMSDMDIILYQILKDASFNKRGVMNVDSQWMEIVSTDPRNETNLEPGDAQDRVVRFGLDLIVPRAYVPREYEFIQSIEDWELTYSAIGDTELGDYDISYGKTGDTEVTFTTNYPLEEKDSPEVSTKVTENDEDIYIDIDQVKDIK